MRFIHMKKFLQAIFFIMGLLCLGTGYQLPAYAEPCPGRNAADDFACIQSKLAALELEMDALIKKSVEDYKSMWGKEAVTEGQTRILDAQKAWLQYRNSHCFFGYYSNAISHPRSQEQTYLVCEISKTQERIKEIQKLYLHESPHADGEP